MGRNWSPLFSNRLVVLTFGCTLQSPGELFKFKDAPGHTSDPGNQWDPGLGVFKAHQVMPMVQRKWRSPGLGEDTLLMAMTFAKHLMKEALHPLLDLLQR